MIKHTHALLVYINTGASQEDASLEEFCELVKSAGLELTHLKKIKKKKIEPKYFIGSGKASEFEKEVKRLNIRLVVFNVELTPSQERNLERLFKCQVLDRTALILDIFAQRARSHEGKLQVELAQLRYLSTRLVRGWSHLERQKGGIGLRGPGEKQLETDRRLIRQRIKKISQALKKVSAQRNIQGQARRKAQLINITLVGYTNAGKSTLFNLLTNSDVLAIDKLFATLDPVHRKMISSEKTEVVLSDTVGFLRNLPHDLIAAFGATLEDAAKSDLLLHVIDYSDPNYFEHIAEVNSILHEIGAENIPQIEVFNKLDLVNEDPLCNGAISLTTPRVWLSAKTGIGTSSLINTICQQNL